MSLIHLQGLLRPDALQDIAQLLPQIPFEDGKNTASGAAREVKNNLQSPHEGDGPTNSIAQIIMRAMAASPLLHAAAFPKMILQPTISRYTPGMEYGWHTDSPLMSKGATIRADMSMTLFLSEPASYTGGELVIQTGTGALPFKLAKGDAILYPTTCLHCVQPVTEGERIVAITWLQSMIRDIAQRDLLIRLKTIQETIGAAQPQSGEHLALQQVYSNLVRMWAEV